jgi:hypothetical protein
MTQNKDREQAIRELADATGLAYVRSACTARATRSASSRCPGAPRPCSDSLHRHRAARYFRSGSAENAAVIERVFGD